MTEQEIIAIAYDKGAEEEYQRLESSVMGEVEYSLISELIKKYIIEGSTVVDIGSGPGRYAELLLSKNCKVGVVDLSTRSLNLFKTRINGNYGNQVLFSKKSCATQLEWIDDNYAEAVLLMGPMYHLTNKNEREKATEHAFRILKPGGLIFVVFMSPYPKLNIMMETNTEMLFDQNYLNSMQNNCITNVMFNGIYIEQYRCWPVEGKKLMENQGFITDKMLNIEGLGVALTYNKESIKTPIEKEKLLNTLRSTCENPNLLGVTSQYLYIGRKN